MFEGGADYEQLPQYEVTFWINENIKCFNISITDDDIEENVESFEIFFDDSLRYSGIYPLIRNPRIYPLSTARVAVISIYDDDCKFSSVLHYCSYIYLTNLQQPVIQSV